MAHTLNPDNIPLSDTRSQRLSGGEELSNPDFLKLKLKYIGDSALPEG